MAQVEIPLNAAEAEGLKALAEQRHAAHQRLEALNARNEAAVRGVLAKLPAEAKVKSAQVRLGEAPALLVDVEDPPASTIVDAPKEESNG